MCTTPIRKHSAALHGAPPKCLALVCAKGQLVCAKQHLVCAKTPFGMRCAAGSTHRIWRIPNWRNSFKAMCLKGLWATIWLAPLYRAYHFLDQEGTLSFGSFVGKQPETAAGSGFESGGPVRTGGKAVQMGFEDGLLFFSREEESVSAFPGRREILSESDR